MNTSILCLVGLLAATPAEQAAADQAASVVTTVYRPSPAFEAALTFRGQSPGFQPPVHMQPQPDATFGGPTFGDPAFGGPGMPVQGPVQGPIYQSEPLPPSTVIGPGADPFLPCPPAAPMPLAPNPYGGYYFGLEYVYVKPFFESNQSMIVADPFLTSANSIDFDWDLEPSYRFFTGFSGSDGMGFRARYWNFDEDVSMSALGSAGAVIFAPEPLTPVPAFAVAAGAGQAYVARQDLELNVLDLEGTWHEDLTWGSITTSAGVRLARIEEEKRFVVVGGVPASLGQAYDFDGAGPTVSLLGRKRLFTTNASLFASGRFSLLYGESSFAEVASVGPAAFRFAGNGDDDLIPVTELQFGVESSRCCRCFGGSTFFYRAGVESQVWFDALPSGNLGFLGITLGSGWAF